MNAQTNHPIPTSQTRTTDPQFLGPEAGQQAGGGKLEFEEAYPSDWDVFNGWHAGPVPVTRAEAARGLRRTRRMGRVLSRGSHTYCLIGMNTVILRPRGLRLTGVAQDNVRTT